MKFSLIKCHPVPFPPIIRTSISAFSDAPYGCGGHVVIPTDIIPVQNSESEREKCSRLSNLLTEYARGRTTSDFMDVTKMWNLDLEISIAAKAASESSTNVPATIRLYSDNMGNCMEGLLKLSDGKARVQIRVRSDLVENVLNTHEMSISGGAQVSYCSDNNVTLITSDINQRAGQNKTHLALCWILVTFPDDKLSDKSRNMALSAVTPILSINEKILSDQLLSDVKIIPANGVPIKAHKVFLASQSSVFLTMFQTDMKESRECVVEIPDMSEESVRALIKYLYYHDASVADKSCQAVFEIFSAAHKYHIETLETLLRDVFRNKGADWFEVDIAVRLFILARNLVPMDEKLKLKAAQVLKGFSSKLGESTAYQDLFTRDPKGAMEFCRYAFDA